MTRHFHLVLWIPLGFFVLFLIIWINIYMNEMVSFEDYVLEKQINYAADSAVETMILESDLNLDYANGDFSTVNPKVALDDFVHSMCLDFQLNTTDTTREALKTKNIKSFTVCTYDGIYAYSVKQTEDHSFELVQSPKLPYFYKGDNGTQYCLTLDPTRGYWDIPNGKSGKYEIHKYGIYAKEGGTQPPKDVQRAAINAKVADVVNWSLYETYSTFSHGNDSSIELPATGSGIKGQQPVRTPTVIAVMEGNIKVVNTPILAEAIGGAQMEDNDPVVGFTFSGYANTYRYVKNGEVFYGDNALKEGGNACEVVKNAIGGPDVRCYAYQSWWNNHTYLINGESKITNNLPPGVGVHNDGYVKNGTRSYFDSPFEAATKMYVDIHLVDSEVRKID